MRIKRTYLLASALALALIILHSGHTSPSRHTSILAEAGSLGVYWDEGCTASVESLEWGNIDAGGTADATVYIRNESEKKVPLSIETDGWDAPSAPHHISLGWAYGDAALGPGETVQTGLPLAISPEVTGITDFTFITIITATTFSEMVSIKRTIVVANCIGIVFSTSEDWVDMM